jgi:Amt family ammonium transporter
LASQLIGTVVGCGFAAFCGAIIYGLLKRTMGIRLSEEEERQGADLSIHKVAANPEVGFGG